MVKTASERIRLAVLAFILAVLACVPYPVVRSPEAGSGGLPEPPGATVTPTQASVSPAATVEPSPVPLPGLELGLIAFCSGGEDGWDDIYVMNADGSDVRRVAAIEGNDMFPQWSPDGQRITFESTGGPGTSIQVVNLNGSDLVQLTGGTANSEYLDWSPDSSRIVFASNRGGDYDLYQINADGSALRQITDTSGVNEVDAHWSPDGSRIAYLCGALEDPECDICTIHPDGSHQTNLTGNPSDYFRPVWSPDGNQIAYTSSGWQGDLWVMNADGGGQRNLTDLPGQDNMSAFSPDGTRIAFWSDRDGDFEIFTVSSDGGEPYQLTHNEEYDHLPVWSPDGNWLVFVSSPSPGETFVESYIRIVGADGRGLRTLVPDPPGGSFPSWQP
jgi:Tol biopolymer transport system component